MIRRAAIIAVIIIVSICSIFSFSFQFQISFRLRVLADKDCEAVKSARALPVEIGGDLGATP